MSWSREKAPVLISSLSNVAAVLAERVFNAILDKQCGPRWDVSYWRFVPVQLDEKWFI